MSRKQTIIIAAATFVGIGWFYLLSATFGAPMTLHLNLFTPGKTAYMKACPEDIHQRWVPLDTIAPFLQQAVVIAEDDRFFDHPGFDWEAIKTAARTNWKRGEMAHGASTISQQLARNLFLSPNKSLWRKARELIIALKLERDLPKKRILELYLNVVEWGDCIYGAEAAARHYFGKPAAALTKHEAAWLAAILPQPRFYDTHRNGAYLTSRTTSIESRL